ncbi:hypothetical protein V4S33_11035 [Enterococcus cecorum]
MDYKVKLTIISYGPKFDQIKEWINKEHSSTLEILLYGEKTYDELNRFYENTDLYIGMGTTVLEARLEKFHLWLYLHIRMILNQVDFFIKTPLLWQAILMN